MCPDALLSDQYEARLWRVQLSYDPMTNLVIPKYLALPRTYIALYESERSRAKTTF